MINISAETAIIIAAIGILIFTVILKVLLELKSENNMLTKKLAEKEKKGIL